MMDALHTLEAVLNNAEDDDISDFEDIEPEQVSGSEGEDHDETDEEREEFVIPRRKKKKRLLNSVDDCLDETKFDPIDLVTVHTKKPDIPYSNMVLVGNMAEPKKPDPIYWSVDAPDGRGSQRGCDVVRQPSGFMHHTKELKTIREFFDCMISPGIIQIMIERTSANMKEFYDKLPDQAKNNNKNAFLNPPSTDVVEFHAFIGLCIMRGLHGQGMHSLNSLWSEFGHPIYSGTMSRRRFQFLIVCLAFEQKSVTVENWPYDKAASIRTVFELWNDNIGQVRHPSDWLTIDESMPPMRHMTSVKTYNPRKPSRYGATQKSLNDALYPYTYRVNIYAGKPQRERAERYYYIQGIDNYVIDLVKGLSKFTDLRGKNITMDRLYGGIPLAQWLLSRDISTIMIMKTGRRGIPKELLDVKDREVHSKTMHYELTEKDLALCTYTTLPKSGSKKNVVVLTTCRPLRGQTKDDKAKPSVYKLYDFTKVGTDIMDQKVEKFSAKFHTRTWGKVIVSFILDTSRVNAITCHCLATGKDVHRFDPHNTIYDLAMSFLKPYLVAKNLVGLGSKVLAKYHFVMGRTLV